MMDKSFALFLILILLFFSGRTFSQDAAKQQKEKEVEISKKSISNK